MRLRQGEKGERGSPWRGFIYYVYCGARGRKAIVGMEDLQNQTNYTDNQTENWKKTTLSVSGRKWVFLAQGAGWATYFGRGAGILDIWGRGIPDEGRISELLLGAAAVDATTVVLSTTLVAFRSSAGRTLEPVVIRLTGLGILIRGVTNWGCFSFDILGGGKLFLAGGCSPTPDNRCCSITKRWQLHSQLSDTCLTLLRTPSIYDTLPVTVSWNLTTRMTPTPTTTWMTRQTLGAVGKPSAEVSTAAWAATHSLEFRPARGRSGWMADVIPNHFRAADSNYSPNRLTDAAVDPS